MKIKNPLFAVVNHYRPVSDEKLISLPHGKGTKRGREDGRDLLKRFLNSLQDNASFKYDTLIVDNASSTIINEIPIAQTHNYISLKTDTEGGLTRAWNICASFGYLNGNDFIFVCNDDIEWNSSVNHFFSSIENSNIDLSNALWGIKTLSSGPHSSYPSDKITEVTKSDGYFTVSGENVLHGHLFGFHRTYFEKYSIDNKLLSDPIETTNPWGGNEKFQILHRQKGAQLYVNGFCTIEHGGLGSWRHRREMCS